MVMLILFLTDVENLQNAVSRFWKRIKFSISLLLMFSPSTSNHAPPDLLPINTIWNTLVTLLKEFIFIKTTLFIKSTEL